jgi:hypothetical protein
MRNLTIFVTALAVAACTRTGNADNATANQPAPAPAPLNAAAPANVAAPAASGAVAALPPGFPDSDPAARGAECVVYLGLARQAGATPGGRDAPIMAQSADQWRAALGIDGHMSEQEIQQLVGSTVNTLTSVPAAQRDAAAAWCVAHAPEPDPDR